MDWTFGNDYFMSADLILQGVKKDIHWEAGGMVILISLVQLLILLDIDHAHQFKFTQGKFLMVEIHTY